MVNRRENRMNAKILKNRVMSVGLVIFLAHIVYSQNNQSIWWKYCEAHPRDVCFNPIEGAVDTVGRNVFELGGTYRFCLAVDSINSGFAPVRVIIVLDNSGSMCSHYGATGCCVPGDGSGMCSRNDPDNKRVDAAKMFVDSLRTINPLSEVGVLVFATSVTSTLQPLSLNLENNYNRIISAIESAGCRPTTTGGGATGGTTTSAGLAKTTGTNTTNCGLALQQALIEIDRNYDSMSPELKEGRHIILLTDGAWDDVATRSPQTLYNNYQTQFPDRALPRVHGIFLSDSATHVAHGYPPAGCAQDTLVNLAYLQQAAQLTNGIYEPGSHPENVVEKFRELLAEIIKIQPQTLTHMVVTNTTNGVTRTNKTIDPVESNVPKQAHYHATIDNLPLVSGLNTLIVQQIVQRPGKETPDTTTSTVYIYRTEEWTSEIIQSEYEVYCRKDSSYISITVTPDTLPLNKPFTVNSSIALKPTFILDSIEVRVFTQFPDADPFTIAVFHLEHNLKNSTNNTEATGTGITYSESGALFGSSAINGGSFTLGGINLSGDFALEAWIRPSNTGAKTDIFSGSGFTLSIDADRFLYITADGVELMRAGIPLDGNTWSHVAVSRVSGAVRIFINGMDASDPAQYGKAIVGGVTITCPAGGLLDEVRISNSSRMRTNTTALRLDIPSIKNPTWTIAGKTSSQEVLILTPGMWNNGNIQFQFASPVSGKLVVNFQHKGDVVSQWSKNGNAVFAAGDLEGPYVKQAIFTPGPLGDIYDTLKVIFSEPVRCDSLKKNSVPSASFKIFGPDNIDKSYVLEGARYIDDQGCPNKYITEAVIITIARVDGIVARKDSIMLFGTAVDTAGNPPDTTRKGPIVPGPGLGVSIIPYQNEAHAPSLIPQGIRNRTGIKEVEGKVIIIQTRNRLVPGTIPGTNKETYAHKTIIYDAVANVVAVDLPLLPFPNNDRMYYIVWNGTNLQKRRVASGAYLLQARVSQTNEPEKFVTLQCKFSIKWNPGKL